MSVLLFPSVFVAALGTATVAKRMACIVAFFFVNVGAFGTCGCLEEQDITEPIDGRDDSIACTKHGNGPCLFVLGTSVFCLAVLNGFSGARRLRADRRTFVLYCIQKPKGLQLRRA